MTQQHEQNEHTLFAYFLSPAPSAREITDVPPTPSNKAIAKNIINIGVDRETAATM
jgi:hypothetical protein